MKYLAILIFAMCLSMALDGCKSDKSKIISLDDARFFHCFVAIAGKIEINNNDIDWGLLALNIPACNKILYDQSSMTYYIEDGWKNRITILNNYKNNKSLTLISPGKDGIYQYKKKFKGRPQAYLDELSKVRNRMKEINRGPIIWMLIKKYLYKNRIRAYYNILDDDIIIINSYNNGIRTNSEIYSNFNLYNRSDAK